MKKLFLSFFVVSFLLLDATSPKSSGLFTIKAAYVYGSCVISIYRANPNGTYTMVYHEITEQNSQEACNARRDYLLDKAEQDGW